MRMKCLPFTILAALSLGVHAEEVLVNKCESNSKREECHTLRSAKLAPITVTANRVDSSVVGYAGQVSVLGQNEFSKSSNIVENMSQVPGFDLGDDFGRQIGAQFKIRGFGYQTENRVIIEQDGVKRSPSLFSNHISSFRVDSNLLKRAEVIKGGSSVLHGSGAIGGIVSMQTKGAEDFLSEGKNTGFTLGGRYDSNKSKSVNIAAAIKPDSIPVDFLVYAKKSKFGDVKLADGGVYSEREKKQITQAGNDENITNAFVKVGWDINDGQRLSLSHYQYNEKLDTTWQTLWHRDPGDDPVRGKLKQKDTVLDYSIAPPDNDWLALSVKLYKSNASYHRTWDDKGSFYTNKDKRWGINLKNRSFFSTGPLEHELVAGIDYENRNEDAIFYRGDVNEYSDFGSFPNYYKDLGIYAQDIMSFNKFDVTLGARYDAFRRGVNVDGRAKYSEKKLSPKFGLSYEVLDGIRLLGSYSETFRAPEPKETSADGPLNPHYWYKPNNQLKPEIAKEYEIGFSVDKQNLFGDDDLYLKATYFNGKIKDMISLKRTPELGTPPDIGDGAKYREYAQYQNVSNAKRKGFEIESKYRINGWELGAGFDHLKITDGEEGKLLQPSTNKFYFNAAYTYQPWDLTAGLKLTHWSKPKRDEYVRTFRGKDYYYVNKAYTIVDFKGSWKPEHTGIGFFDHNFTLNFGVNNLFNKQRLNPNNYTISSNVGKARNYYVAFEKRF